MCFDSYGDLVTANGKSVIYDAFGRMVENQNGSQQFLYSPSGGGQPFATMNGQTLAIGDIPLPGGAFVIYKTSGLYQINHPDWLGSARLLSTASQGTNSATAYAPFGEGYTGKPAAWIQFTSDGRVSTVNDVNQNQTGTLEDFMFRRYNATQGRWISPDPAGVGAVDPTNPQTWNRYAYVMNNPLGFVDPSGLKPILVCITWSVTTSTGEVWNPASEAPAASGQDCEWADDGTGDLPPGTLLPGEIPGPPPISVVGAPTFWTPTPQQQQCIDQQVATEKAVMQHDLDNAAKGVGKSTLYGAAGGAVWGCGASTIGGPVGCFLGGFAGGFLGGLGGAGVGLWNYTSTLVRYQANLPYLPAKYDSEIKTNVQKNCGTSVPSSYYFTPTGG